MYRFPFQALLNQRQIIEDLRQKELGQLEADLARLRGQIEARILDMAHLQQDLAALQADGVGAGQSWLYDSYYKRLCAEITQDRQKAQTVEAACSRKRADLLTAVQNRKIMEKLKEKGLRAFIEQDNRQQTQFIDEISACRHAREMQACQFGDSGTDI